MRTPPDLRLRLAPEGHSVPAARHAVANWDGFRGALQATLGLLVTELVTNCILHAGMRPEDRIEVRAWLSGDPLRVEVHDPGPGFDPNAAMSGGPGQGLRLVSELSHGWGVRRTTYGNCVWFQLEAVDERHVSPMSPSLRATGS
jgi:hypothetical protein